MYIVHMRLSLLSNSLAGDIQGHLEAVAPFPLPLAGPFTPLQGLKVIPERQHFDRCFPTMTCFSTWSGKL
jgi:hypothetical protein